MMNIQARKVEAKGRVQKRILARIQDLSKVQFFHVKCKNNTMVDLEEKQGYRLRERRNIVYSPPFHC